MKRTKKYTRWEKVQDGKIHMTGKCTGQENIPDGIEYRMGNTGWENIQDWKYTKWERIQDGKQNSMENKT